MTYALWIGWCALESVDTEIKHVDNWLIDWLIDWLNFLMLDLTFGSSFKVKRWFTGFGELSFRWIQICIGSPMRRSSCFLGFKIWKLHVRNHGLWIFCGTRCGFSILLTTEVDFPKSQCCWPFSCTCGLGFLPSEAGYFWFWCSCY